MKEIPLLDYGVNGMESAATAVQCFQMGHFFSSSVVVVVSFSFFSSSRFAHMFEGVGERRKKKKEDGGKGLGG